MRKSFNRRSTMRTTKLAIHGKREFPLSAIPSATTDFTDAKVKEAVKRIKRGLTIDPDPKYTKEFSTTNNAICIFINSMVVSEDFVGGISLLRSDSKFSVNDANNIATKHLHIVFINLDKAVDTVPRALIWMALRSQNIQ